MDWQDNIRKSSSSISINIVEGCGRSTNADFARFLQIALGSCYECEYELFLATDLNFATRYDAKSTLNELKQLKYMLITFYKKIKML